MRMSQDIYLQFRCFRYAAAKPITVARVIIEGECNLQDQLLHLIQRNGMETLLAVDINSYIEAWAGNSSVTPYATRCRKVTPLTAFGQKCSQDVGLQLDAVNLGKHTQMSSILIFWLDFIRSAPIPQP